MMNLIGITISFTSLLAETQVGEAPTRQVWLGFVMAGVLGAAIIALNFKGSKRGHQD